MQLVNKLEFSDFSLYFMGYPQATAGKHWTDCEALIELTHNHGSETDDKFEIANGNAEGSKGFGHICVSVDNLQQACDRLEKEGYSFQKKLSEGRMRHIAFVKDVDGPVHLHLCLRAHELTEADIGSKLSVRKT